MQLLVLALTVFFLLMLMAENSRALSDRQKLEHVIYVNGTRGKSSVSRLIDAGLRAGGYRVFCKTTGTVPSTIDTGGEERPIIRRGRANIREQLQILHQAAANSAQILVVECMAVDPALQHISQHRMVRADLGVITNVRLDHTDEMGETLEEICEALCQTVPKNGMVFTADAAHAEAIGRYAQALGSRVILSIPDGTLPDDIDFEENVALALEVCRHLGVKKETALQGMRHYRKDPYALALFSLPGGAIFINGLSINDPQSTEIVWHTIAQRHNLTGKRLVLLINNRPDRGYRTQHMIMLAQKLAPSEVWLLGSAQSIVRQKLKKLCPAVKTLCFRLADELPLAAPGQDVVLFAVGNIAGEGPRLIERVRTEGNHFVQ